MLDKYAYKEMRAKDEVSVMVGELLKTIVIKDVGNCMIRNEEVIGEESAK